MKEDDKKHYLRILVTSDWHLTDRPDDEYRWTIFDWIEKRVIRYKIDYVIHLGDITHRKDEHSAALVNRLYGGLRRLTKVAKKVLILKGNHDYDADPAIPFFKFMHRSIKGKVMFFHKATEIGLGKYSYLFLPHTRNWAADYQAKYDYGKYDAVFIHQPLFGAIADNGLRLETGVRPDIFKAARAVYAGDIHTPQSVGKVTYVGAPHPINYGDTFKPRAILLSDCPKDLPVRDLPRTTLRKEIVAISSSAEFRNCGLSAGDMARVTVKLRRADILKWPTIRKKVEAHAKAAGIILGGIKLTELDANSQLPAAALGGRDGDPGKVLRRYAKARRIPRPMLRAGLAIIKGAA